MAAGSGLVKIGGWARRGDGTAFALGRGMSHMPFPFPFHVDPDFACWVDTCAVLINEYGDAIHGDDEEGRIRDAAILVVAADHLWRTRGDGDPSWDRLDVASFVAELNAPEGPMATVSTLLAFVLFLCQRSVLAPLPTLKLLDALEACATAIAEGEKVVWEISLEGWGDVARA